MYRGEQALQLRRGRPPQPRRAGGRRPRRAARDCRRRWGPSGAIRLMRSNLRVVHLQAGQRVRDADLGAQLQHPGEERVERRRQAEVGGEARDPVLDGRPVEDQHVGHEHRVGEPVVRVVERAHRVRERVDGAQRLLERGGAHGGRRHHVRARLQVAALLVGARQVLLDEPHALHGDAVGQRVIDRARSRPPGNAPARPCRCRR